LQFGNRFADAFLVGEAGGQFTTRALVVRRYQKRSAQARFGLNRTAAPALHDASYAQGDRLIRLQRECKHRRGVSRSELASISQTRRVAGVRVGAG
jgi:hypothetical protein